MSDFTSKNKDFNIELNVVANDKKARLELDGMINEYTTKKTIAIPIRMADGKTRIKEINTLVNSLGETVKQTKLLSQSGHLLSTSIDKVSNSAKIVNSEMKKFKDSNNHLINSFERTTSAGERLKTQVVEYTDKQQKLHKITTEFKWDDQAKSWVQMGASIREATQDLVKYNEEQEKLARANANVTTSVNKYNQTMSVGGQAVKATVTDTIKMTEGFETTKTTVTQFTNSMGELVTTTTNFNKVGDQWVQTGGKVTQISKDTTEAIKKQGQETEKTTTKTRTFNDILKASFTKMVSYYISSLPLRLFQKAMSETITTIKDFDKAITELGKVSNYSGQQLQNYAKQLGEIGAEVARTRTEMVEAATEFVKSGYNEEDAAQLAKIAALYQNTADEALSASDATSVLISQMKAYKDEFPTAESVIGITDAINKVSADFAVSSGDIGKGLTAAGAALSTYGNSFEETIAMLTAGTEIFQKKSQQVARGLNTVASRIVNNEKELAKYGVTIRDEVTGDLLSTYEILYQLSEGGAQVTKTWKEMTNEEQVNLGKALAGVNQYKVFAAVMNNFGQAVAVSDDLLNAEGSTLEQNAVYMESLEAKTSALKQQFENFVLGDGALTKFAKLLVDIGTDTLKFLNSEFGQTVLQAIAITAAINGIIHVLGLIKASAIISSLSAIWTSLMAGEGVITALTLSIEACPLFWGALAVTAILLVVKAIDSASDSIEKHTDKLKEATQQYDETKRQLDEVQSKLDSVKESIEEINKNPLNPTDEQRLKTLKEEEAVLSNHLTILQEIERQKKSDQYKEAEGVLTYTEPTMVYVDSDDYPAPIDADYDRVVNMPRLTTGEKLQQTTQEIIDQQKVIDDLIEKRDTLLKLGMSEESYGVQQITAQIANAVKTQDTLRKTASDYAEVIQDAVDKGDQNSKVVQENQGYLTEYAKAINKVINTGKQYAESDEEVYKRLGLTQEQIAQVTAELANNASAYEDSVDPITDAAIALGFVTEKTNQQVTSLDELVDKASEMRSVYETLTKAVEEYNTNGVVSAETLGKIVKLGGDYVSMLEIQNGQMVLNTKSLENQADAWVKSAKSALYKQAIDRINSLTAQDLSTDTQNLTTDIEDSTTAVDNYTSSLIKAANAKIGMMSGGDRAKMRQVTNEIIQETLETAKALEEMGKNMFVDIPSSSSSRSTTDNAKTLYNNKFKEEKEMLDNQLELEYITNEEYYKQLSDLIERYYGESSGVHEEYMSEYLDAEADLYKKMQTLYKQDISNQKEALKNKLDDLKDVKELEVDKLEKEIDALKDKKEAEIDEIEVKIDNLKELKEAEQDRWDAQIDALKKSNTELKSQNELMEKQESLAKAKSTRVKILGESGKFEYGKDENAITKAEQELATYEQEQEYEKKLEILENFKKQANDSYEKQINDLEKHKKELKRQYEAQIKDLEKHKDEVKENYDAQIQSYENMITEFERQSERLLEGQLEEVSNENEVWKVRLSNVVSFVNQYNKVLSELGSDNTNVQSDYQGETTIETASVDVSTHAKGVSKVGSNEISIVGENPNKELVIGSKINGTLMSLSKGDGVVNAKSTNTLAGLLNNLGSFASSNFGNGNGVLSNTTNNASSINIGNITLPQVTNGNEFVDYLQNFALDMTQKAFA